MTNPLHLNLQDAVLLLHAQLSYIATNSNIRAIFIKGPGVVSQGLRQSRPSSDVDVWVEPSNVQNLISKIETLGWHHRPVDSRGSAFTPHAITLYHKQWPCDIDVHLRIPGMEATDDVCFDLFWAEKDKAEMAGRNVWIPSIHGSIVILALNSLRSMSETRAALEYQHLKQQAISTPTALLDIAIQTNSTAALKPFITSVMPMDDSLEWPKTSTHWDFLSSFPNNARRRLQTIKYTPLRRKPMMLFHALFPNREVLLMENIYIDTSWRNMIRVYISRYSRGARAAIEVLMAGSRK